MAIFGSKDLKALNYKFSGGWTRVHGNSAAVHSPGQHGEGCLIGTGDLCNNTSIFGAAAMF
jgi:hypothetical protein